MTGPIAFAGIDLSTTTARCVLLDAGLNMLCVARVPHTSLASKLEQRGERWVSSVEAAIREAAELADVGLDRIAAVGIATQGVASVMVDDSEVAAAQSWLSAGDDSSPDFRAETVDSWYVKSGRHLSPSCLAGRLLRTGAELDQRWALAGDLLAHELTGAWKLDPCLAATTGLLDQCTRDWSAELLDSVNVARGSLSQIVPAGTAAGTARGAMAMRLGLSPDAVVASPTQDQRAAVLIADPAEASLTVTFGTAVAIVRRAHSCESRLPGQIPLTPGLRPDTWWHEGVVPAAGATLDWWAALLGLTTTAALLDLASQVHVGAAEAICEPWFGGRGTTGWDSNATGGLRQLQLGAGRSDVARAVVDAVCTEIARNVESLGTASDVRIIGRATSHPVIAETLATMLGAPVIRVLAEEPTAYGAALLGAQASGHVASAHAASLAGLRTETIESTGIV